MMIRLKLSIVQHPDSSFYDPLRTTSENYKKKYPNLGYDTNYSYICKMRIIAFRTLRTFFEKPDYADSEASLRAWYHDAKTAEWISSNDLKQQYKNASIVGEGRVVFNIKGNVYRLVVAVDYEFQVIFIRFIGTHKQYDKIDAKTI